jgi:hypothetical protein
MLTFLRVRIRFAADHALPPPLWNRKSPHPSIALNDGVVPVWYSSASAAQHVCRVDSWQQVSAGTWLRVIVQEEGIYRITAEQLRQFGVSLTPEEIPTLKLFGTGGEPLPESVSEALREQVVEQPLIVRTTADGQLRDILFYAAAPSGFRFRDSVFEHFLNPFSSVNTYLLTWGRSPGLRAQPLPVPYADSVYRPATCTARIAREEELYNPFSLPSGRDWLGPTMDPSMAVVYTTPLPELERSGTVRYRFVVANRATVPARIQVFETDQLLWEGTLGATSDYTEAVATPPIVVELPAESIPRDNRSTLRFLYSTAAGTGFGHVDWVEIHYPRRFVASDNTFEFFTEPQWEGVLEFSIVGFSGDELWGFDVTDRRRPQLLENLAHAPGVFVFRIEQQRNQPRRFFLSRRLLTPRIERAQVLGLRQRQQGVPLLIITHPELRASAEAYRRYRDSTGVEGLVVTTEALFDEFAAGMPDPTAIRNFLAFALSTWQPAPRFVVLWGDAHYDYKGIATKTPNYVPTYESANPSTVYNAIASYATDDYYTWLQGEDALPDIALGRIPVSSDADGFWMVEKLRRYERSSAEGLWRTTVTLVADDGPTSRGYSDGALHTDQSEGLSRRLPPFLLQRKLYLVEYPAQNVPGGRRKPGITQDLVAGVNAGTLLLNWTGHGNPRLWAHEQVFERETTTPLFQNADRFFFLTAATCDFARFDNPQVPSGSEALLLSRLGGAIGVFAASRLVYATPNAAIVDSFYQSLLGRQSDGTFPSVGEAYMKTKLQRFDILNDRKYVLLGDPVLRLLLPTGIVVLDSLNGVPVGDSLPPVAAWSRVRLAGRVLSPARQLWEDFSGRLFVALFDAPVTRRVVEEFSGGKTSHIFVKLGGMLHQGIYRVERGRWQAEFIVPREVSFSSLPGRLFIAAFAEDGRSAAGVDTSIRFAGIATSEAPDTVGPRIWLYIDDPSFRPGDLVRSVPELIAELWDESGINTAATLGRRIEAWIDEETSSLDLTPLFQLLPDSSGRGIVRKPLLGLSAGMHRVRLRAWDVYGNFSVAETYFRIADELTLEEPSVVPNPVSQFPVRFSFLFSGNESARVEVLISDILGTEVYRQEVELQPLRRVELLWDGRTRLGIPVAPGVYVYRVRLLQGSGTVVSRTFVVVR